MNADGAAIRDLLKKSNPDSDLLIDKIDWNRVEPYWLVAEAKNKVVGCTQVVTAFPMGYIEWMAVDGDEPERVRAVASRELGWSAVAILYKAGVSIVMSHISFHRKNVKRMLKKRGFVTVGQGNRMLKLLRD